MKFCMIRKVQYRIDIPQFEHYTWVSNIDALPPRRSFLTTLVWFIKFANGIEWRLAHQRWGKRTKNLAAVAINLYGRAITHNISKRCSLALISFGYILSIQWNLCIRVPHDDVIKWRHFPRYWSFVRGIHQSTVNSPHKGQWRGA